MIKKLLLLTRSSDLLILGIILLLFTSKALGQAAVTEIHTDWKGYWKSNGVTGVGNRPDTENNLIGFKWNGTTYSTGVDDATLTSKVSGVNIQKFRALKINTLSYTSNTYFLQGSMIDGSSAGRILTPALATSGSSTAAELASRLTDGKNGLALGTGIANIATNSVSFKIGTSNLNVDGLGDGVPDLIVTQVAQPGGADVFKFVNASGGIVGNSITVNFASVPEAGSYSLDLFNASSGTIASSFVPQETRDIRLLGYDTSAFGINASNAAQVDRFVVSFSGSSDCAFMAFNANSLKKSELSLVKKGTVRGCGIAGDIIDYTFEVTNTGDGIITNVTVTDPLPGIVMSSINQGSTLAAGETKVMTATYTITSSDVTAGKVSNSANVTGLDPSLNTVQDISGQTNSDDIGTVTSLLTAPTGTSSQLFCAINLPTIASLSATGTAIKWYGSSTGGSVLSATTPLVNGTHYYASQTLGSCESTARFDVRATVSNPSAPTGSSSQSFCNNASPTIADLNATGTVVQWYSAASGGTALVSTTSLINGTHYYATQTTSGCESTARLDVTVTISNPSAPTGSSSQSFCVSASPPTVANLNATGTAIKWYSAISGGSALVTTTPLIDGTHYFASQTVSGCESTLRFDVIVIIDTPSSSPTLGTVTQPTCSVSTGSVKLSGLPTSGLWTLNQNGTPIYTTTGGSGLYTVLGLTAVGSPYVFSVSNGSCTSSSTGNVIINSAVTKTWNGTAWLPAGVPTSSDAVLIDGDYSAGSNGDLNVCSIKITEGKKITIEAGKTLIIQNNLTVNGILDVLDKGSLVMVNDAGTVDGTGTTNVYRTTTPYKKKDYVYWSTPVSSGTGISIPSTFTGWRTSSAYEYRPDKFFDGNGDGLDDNGDDWTRASTMVPAKGYIVMVPDPVGATQVSTVNFKGTVNNGVQKITSVIAKGSYLLGNPYPSAIDADAFILENAGVLDGTLSFWTHNTAIQLATSITNGTAGSGVYAYTSDDYAYYNLTGGVNTKANSPGNNSIPLGKIASTQGFFVTANASITGTNEIVFNNSMRLKGGATLDNSQFYKKDNSKTNTAKTIEKNRLWLNLSNKEGVFKQTLVGYITGATNDNETLYDGATLDGNEYGDFYSVNQGKNLVIQGRKLPFDEMDEVALGYRTGVEGTFTINIEQADGFLANQGVYLEDKTTSAIVDLKSGAYSFTTAKGTFNDRFVLRYTDTSKLGIGDVVAKGKGVIVSVKNRQIKINSFDETIKAINVYDLKGSLVYQTNKIDKNEFIIDHLASSNQFLIVMTQLESGKWVSEEIIFHE